MIKRTGILVLEIDIAPSHYIADIYFSNTKRICTYACYTVRDCYTCKLAATIKRICTYACYTVRDCYTCKLAAI